MPALPSLKGLRAVEASARLGSFTAAASELHVTQTAVSRLVREVEQQLGVVLFRRSTNALATTDACARLLPHLSAGFASLERGVAEARAHTHGLTVACGPAFAMRWLIPRLARFHARHPEIDVRLATALPSEAPELRLEWDAAIRLLAGVPEGLAGVALFGARILAVARPDLAARIHGPDDLADHTLLAVGEGSGDWPRWFQGLGRELPERAGILAFDSSVFALQAALDGIGVALVREPYVADDLQAGRLVPVSPHALEDQGRMWYLIHRPGRASAGALAALRDWLLERVTEEWQSPLADPGNCG